MTNYKKQAQQWANSNGVALKILGSEYRPYFPTDKESRWVFKLKLTVNRRSYTFNFGQSIAAGGEEPCMYDILACLQKYDVGSFEDFCSEFGYNEDSRTAERTYKAVCKEYAAVCRLFTTEQIEQLQEIY
jgi:hypothetical protein